MTNTYIYNDTFISLISLIYTLIKTNIIPDNIKSEKEYQKNLLDEPVYLNISNEKEIIDKIKNMISKFILSRIYYVYLSDNNNKELIIYDFLKNTLKYGNTTINRRNIDSVNDVINISNYVSRENHRMKGFLRFKEMKNFYYAEITPTNNIIYLLIHHFQKRLVNEYWIIKDTKRNIYAVYDKQEVKILNDQDIIKLNLDFSSKEMKIENLWKSFFETIGIKQRENRRNQRNFMPKKYWKNMIEMEDKI